jgi:type III secretion protein J
VHVVLPERSPAGEETTPSSAAVFIKHHADASLDTVQPQIRRLVTNSIPGLTGERVSLVLVPAAADPQPAAPVAAAAERGDNWRLAAVVLGVLALFALVGLGALAWKQGLLRRAQPAATSAP